MLNSGGFDARTLRELQRLGPYNNKPTSDYAHMMAYASLVEYAYITQTGVQSNPDPATITLSRKQWNPNMRISGSKQWIKKRVD